MRHTQALKKSQRAVTLICVCSKPDIHKSQMVIKHLGISQSEVKDCSPLTVIELNPALVVFVRLSSKAELQVCQLEERQSDRSRR